MIRGMQAAGSDARLGVAGSPAFLGGVAAFLVAGGVALGVVRFLGGSRFERDATGVLASMAFGGVVATVGVLVRLGLRDRPVLLVPAAVFLVPLSFLSFAGILLPLLVPAVLLLVAYARRSAAQQAAGGREALALLAVLVCLVASVAALLVHEDPRSWRDETGGASTSDVVTVAEALLSLALQGAALASGWLLARPRPSAPDERPHLGGVSSPGRPRPR
jgi:hypothetical protein